MAVRFLFTAVAERQNYVHPESLPIDGSHLSEVSLHMGYNFLDVNLLIISTACELLEKNFLPLRLAVVV